jgi:hypothetical protein
MNLLYRFLILIAFIQIVSCSKDRSIKLSPKPPIQFSDEATNALLKKITEKPQLFTINENNYQVIYGKHGTSIGMDTQGFFTKNGTKVVPPFQFELLEMLSAKDIILNGKSTTSGGKILTTGGQIFIKASKNGQEIFSAEKLDINIPANKIDPNMRLFYGEEPGNGTFDWIPVECNTIVIQEPRPQERDSCSLNSSFFIGEKGGYSIFGPKTGWINCDYFYKFTGPKTKIKLSSASPKITEIMSFLYFYDIKSVIRVYGGLSLEVPIGQKANLICFASTTDGKIFTMFKDIEAMPDDTIEIKLEESTEAKLVTYLENLSKL